ncbi:two-component system response regulator [Burkholderia stagnalis]|uniref:Response regulator transcription factor n=1 Tax=Burkholderia stagnalis TaxID=1503054 RepID=A0A6L3MU80_9BURK|nr:MULTISPECIES: response regulator [Burkholderia cepacia complex]KAB0636013.1 response regulator transcription factor [Burkholderia stagnalis]KUY71156.1 two-component system response regulator [Burkholderia cepacia]KVA34980.1 two-component system response regulator [Burkholderia cepacia]KVA47420.1 two-component system response regulator [Burkholderia cepacia]KVO50960.1 two-component system response regulator [Burkholderia stagnalis]
MNPLILIAEDDPEIAEILDAYLAYDRFRTYRVSHGQAVLDVLPMLKPDLILLDVRMPQKDGWEVLLEVRRRSDTPIVILTALDREIDRLQGLRFGADDYITKPFNPAEVVARIRAILRRFETAKSGRVIKVGKLEIDTQSYLTTIRTGTGGTSVSLTLTEFRLLAHLASSPNRVFTRSELVSACLPDGDALERTVDSHISRLRKKLECAGAPGMPDVMRGVGYRLLGVQ